MTLGYHFLFSSWIRSDGAGDNNSHLSDPGKPNLISRFRGPTLGVHLRSQVADPVAIESGFHCFSFATASVGFAP